MALNLYGRTNYETVVPLSVEYAREAAVAVSGMDTQWRYTRHATKTYKFKGLTEAAAKACLADKRRQYTRRFMAWQQYSYYFRSPTQAQYATGMTEPSPYMDQVAQFSVSRDGDAPVYTVQIAIDETVAVYSTRDYDPSTASGCASIEALFATMIADPQAECDLSGATILGVRYYHAYVHEYSYDEGLTGDVEVAS